MLVKDLKNLLKNYEDRYLWIFDCDDSWYKCSIGKVRIEDNKLTLVEDCNKAITEKSLKVGQILGELESIADELEVTLEHFTPRHYISSPKYVTEIQECDVPADSSNLAITNGLCSVFLHDYEYRNQNIELEG
jgi:hypothetical protein